MIKVFHFCCKKNNFVAVIHVCSARLLLTNWLFVMLLVWTLGHRAVAVQLYCTHTLLTGGLKTMGQVVNTVAPWTDCSWDRPPAIHRTVGRITAPSNTSLHPIWSQPAAVRSGPGPQCTGVVLSHIVTSQMILTHIQTSPCSTSNNFWFMPQKLIELICLNT